MQEMLIRELLIELQDRYQQTRCGCGHPHCKQCRDDQITRSVLEDARAKLKEKDNAGQDRVIT